jgi:hypothetical protein
MCTAIPTILAVEPREQGCRRVAKHEPNCVCEAESVQPDLSPGPVDQSEVVARFVPERDLDRSTMTVKPSLFAHAGTTGMSVTRTNHATPAALAEEQASKNYVGYVTATCSDIRRIEREGRQVFAVYDTAKCTNRAHGDVCQSIFTTKSQDSSMRRSLQLAFSRIPLSASSQLPTAKGSGEFSRNAEE